MNDYDGFATVQNPQDYMNAPAMIIPPDGDNARSSFSPPPILRAAIDASRKFELLSADEIQAQYAEQNVLQQRISDVISRLDVEVKMREAARSLSRLHRKPSDASMSPSMGGGASGHSARKRISKIFSGSGGGSGSSDSKDKRQSIGQQQQRHSMQAEEEAEISSEKIRHLEQLRFDLSQRKALVDKRIIQHHAAVMARALGGVPLPNHRRLQSGASAMSNLSGSSTPGQRQSWVVADTSGKHMRSTSGVSAHSVGADSSLATVREHLPVSAGSQSTYNSRLEEEVNTLAGRVAQAIPGMSPAPQGAMVFISNAFERLLRELADTRNSAEAYHIQAQHSEERIEFLNRELERAGRQARAGSDGSRSETTGLPAGQDAEVAQLRHEIDAEKSTIQQLRTQATQQRAELERTVRSLEEVTRLAVQYESERSELEQALSLLEAKTGTLEEDKMVLLQQRLGATQNSSVLCKEFQRIIGDLMEQHQKELRQLHPKISSANGAPQAIGQQPNRAGTASDPVASITGESPTSTTKTTDQYEPLQARKNAEPARNYNSRGTNESEKESVINSEFSQSPEPLSVHSAIRKPVPNKVPDLRDLPAEHSVSNQPMSRAEAQNNLDQSLRNQSGDSALKDHANDNGHTPLPAPMDSDISLADSIPEEGEEDLSAPRLERIGSEYSADFSEYSRSSSVYPETNSAAQSQASVLPHPHHPNQSQASIARAQDYSFNSNDELL